MNKVAVLSDDGLYRYFLYRETSIKGVGKGNLTWVMLNPSVADAEIDDNTIRKVIKFSENLGYKYVTVVNLYALRTTDPDNLKWMGADPVGPDNDRWLAAALGCSQMVMCGWGTHAEPARVKQFLDIVSRLPSTQLRCLRLNKDGSPGHPLYIPYREEPRQWRLS